MGTIFETKSHRKKRKAANAAKAASGEAERLDRIRNQRARLRGLRSYFGGGGLFGDRPTARIGMRDQSDTLG